MPATNGDVFVEALLRLGTANGSRITEPALNGDVYVEAWHRLGTAIGSTVRESMITETALNGAV